MHCSTNWLFSSAAGMMSRELLMDFISGFLSGFFYSIEVAGLHPAAPFFCESCNVLHTQPLYIGPRPKHFCKPPLSSSANSSRINPQGKDIGCCCRGCGLWGRTAIVIIRKYQSSLSKRSLLYIWLLLVLFFCLFWILLCIITMHVWFPWFAEKCVCPPQQRSACCGKTI